MFGTLRCDLHAKACKFTRRRLTASSTNIRTKIPHTLCAELSEMQLPLISAKTVISIRFGV